MNHPEISRHPHPTHTPDFEWILSTCQFYLKWHLTSFTFAYPLQLSSGSECTSARLRFCGVSSRSRRTVSPLTSESALVPSVKPSSQLYVLTVCVVLLFFLLRACLFVVFGLVIFLVQTTSLFTLQVYKIVFSVYAYIHPTQKWHSLHWCVQMLWSLFWPSQYSSPVIFRPETDPEKTSSRLTFFVHFQMPSPPRTI